MLTLYLTTVLAISQLAAGLVQRLVVEEPLIHREDSSYFASGSVVASSLTALLPAWRPESCSLGARDNNEEASATANISSTLTSSGMLSHYVSGWLLEL